MKLKELTDKNWNNFFTPLRDDYEIVIIQYTNSGSHSFLESMSIGNYYLAYKHDNKYFLLTHNLITKTRVNPDYTIKVLADSRFKEFKINSWFYSLARKAIVPVFNFDNCDRELVDNRAQLCCVDKTYMLSIDNIDSFISIYSNRFNDYSTDILTEFIINSIEYQFNLHPHYYLSKNEYYNLFKQFCGKKNISEIILCIKTGINNKYSEKGIALNEKMATEIAESIKIVNSCDSIFSISQVVYPYDYPEIKPELYHMINDGVMSINDALLISKNNIPIINYQQNPTRSGITVCTYFPLDKNNLPGKIFIDYVYPLDRTINQIVIAIGKSSNKDLNPLFLLL